MRCGLRFKRRSFESIWPVRISRAGVLLMNRAMRMYSWKLRTHKHIDCLTMPASHMHCDCMHHGCRLTAKTRSSGFAATNYKTDHAHSPASIEASMPVEVER